MRNVAIIAACEYYQDEQLQNLVGVNHDITLIKTAFMNSCHCSEEDVFTIENSNPAFYAPTGVQILRTINSISKKYTSIEIDNLFFYYSGHGILKGKELNIILSDTLPESLYGSLSIKQLEDALGMFNNVKHIIVFIDACQQSYISKGSDVLLERIPGISAIFYSCFPTQNSYMLPENEGKGSIYTNCLYEILNSSNSQYTISTLSEALKDKLEKYCQRLSINQIPHTALFDDSIGNVLIKDSLKDSKEGISAELEPTTLDLSRSIWLKDAELADGDQTRFNTFTTTSIVNDYLMENSKYWGIASVKGIGKTFLLQVKRTKLSKKAVCFPNVRPCRETNWATECIKFSGEELFKSNESYEDLKILWKYSIVCYVIRSWLTFQKNSKRKNADLNEIIGKINKAYKDGDLEELTYSYFFDFRFTRLQIIIENVLKISGWPQKIRSQYGITQSIGIMICNAIASTSKKKLVLFLDKLDQAIRQPNSEDTLDCSNCSKAKLIQNCKNELRDTEYCFGDSDDSCSQRMLCCYGCENFSDSYAGTRLRVSEGTSTRNKHCNLWQLLQLALVEAVSDIMSDFHGRIQVMYTIRLEACNYEENIWGAQRAKIMALTCTLRYSREEQERIYKECIANQDSKLLYRPELAQKAGFEDEAFVGVNYICHPYVPETNESIFDIIYRHSFDRTRDIQDFGNMLTMHILEIRKCKNEEERRSTVKQIIEDTAARLAFNTNKAVRSAENSYYFEKIPNIPSYWADPENFEELLKQIDRNVLFADDLRLICRNVNSLSKCPNSGCRSCQHHPFSALYNLGMLGYIVISANGIEHSLQIFLSSEDVTYFHEQDDLQINENTLYLIHPALTKSIEKLKSDKKIMHFSGFVIGKGIKVRQAFLQSIIRDKKSLPQNIFNEKYYKTVQT